MNIYTNKFSAQQVDKIGKFFENIGAKFSPLQYAYWKAEGQGYVASFYKSFKFVLQGKSTDKIAEEFEKFMGISTIVSEQKLFDTTQFVQNDVSFSRYIGTDESGKGDFFGPLVIAGVYVDEELSKKFVALGIKDSKKLDEKTIIKLSAHIRNNAPHSVVVVMPEKYNELYCLFKNLNKLLAWGHARAIENVLAKQECACALSDKFGDESLIKNALLKNGRHINLEQRVRGESYIGVAAASVIARAEFVKRCGEMGKKFGMDFPKGASDKVVLTAKEFVGKFGKDNLKYVAKIHFKTVQSL